ncbi:MAG: hypothetical protein ACYTGC_09545, partial [Planctomycetota bacterium]
RRAAAGRDSTVAVPPHVWAMQELARLETSGLAERGEVHAFFVGLTDIVRQYIERRFGLSAPERTTEEFIREMRHDPRLAETHQTLLSRFLQASDLVKFAQHRPAVDECRHALETARHFVQETIPAVTDEATQPGPEAEVAA